MGTQFKLLEPIGGSAPKFSAGSKTSSWFRKAEFSLNLDCPAQGSPVPSYRLAIHTQLLLYMLYSSSISLVPSYRNSRIVQKVFIITEPIGGSAPKFSMDSEGFIRTKPASQPFSLSCPAQGSPVPSYRLISFFLLIYWTWQLNGCPTVLGSTLHWLSWKNV